MGKKSQNPEKYCRDFLIPEIFGCFFQSNLPLGFLDMYQRYLLIFIDLIALIHSICINWLEFSNIFDILKITHCLSHIPCFCHTFRASVLYKGPFPQTENFPKISLLKVDHILQNFLSAENFPEWKWALIDHGSRPMKSLNRFIVHSCNLMQYTRESCMLTPESKTKHENHIFPTSKQIFIARNNARSNKTHRMI